MGSKRKLAHAEDLNLVPIMNLVTILIPFLLMAAQFISLAVIDSTLPAIGDPTPADPDEDPPLSLSIAITGEGYFVKANDKGKVLTKEEEGEGAADAENQKPTVPCTESGCPTPESYDTAELMRLLNLLKDEYPDEQNVILVPDSKVKYEVIVRTMDATREDPSRSEDSANRLLFPYVVIAGGAE